MHRMTVTQQCILLLISCGGFLVVPDAKCHLFKAAVEKQISSPDMDCYYRVDDYRRSLSNFESPKLIITQGHHPLIAFVDGKSSKLIFAEVTEAEAKIISSIASFGTLGWEKWPIIFTREGKVYLAVYEGYYPRSQPKRIKLFLLDRETGQLTHLETKVVAGDKRCDLWGIYPYHDQFILIGNCNYICLSELPSVLMGGNPTYYHNASFLLDGHETLIRQPIEEPGCYDYERESYEFSTAGGHAVWIRLVTVRGLHYERAIYYSTNKSGTKWSPPLQLYSVNETETAKYHRINDLSLTSSDSSAVILWQDVREGIFFSEVRDGKSHIVKLSDIEKPNITSETFLDASTLKVASDAHGNVYALWAINSGKTYRLYLRIRVNGQWTTETVIHQGPGYLKLPDMKVAPTGTVHIAYVKPLNPDEPHGKFGCFYLRLDREEKSPAPLNRGTQTETGDTLE